VGFIGGGQMASAIIGGIVSSGLLPGSKVHVYDPSPAQIEQLQKQYGIVAEKNNCELVKSSDIIVIAVKPLYAPAVLREVRPVIDTSRHVFVSICAGISLAALAADVPAGTKLVRVMPNTPALVRKGASGFTTGPGVTDADVNDIRAILSAIGVAHQVSEKELEAVTGLSGSGPAYIYVVIEALADGGVKAGLARPIAQSLAAQTVLGAAEMVLKTGQHPGALKDAVCSPGGTTICAVHELEKGGVRAAMIEAVQASCRRAAELAAPINARSQL